MLIDRVLYRVRRVRSCRSKVEISLAIAKSILISADSCVIPLANRSGQALFRSRSIVSSSSSVFASGRSRVASVRVRLGRFRASLVGVWADLASALGD